MEVVIDCLRGAAIGAYLPSLAALRIEVFREYPYLYAGTLEYEAEYLRDYARQPQSLVVLARAGGQVVGAATAMPLIAYPTDLSTAFEIAGLEPETVFYFGESVLQAEFRGRGIGHAFFDAREAAAAGAGFSMTAFCAVERPANHPLCPAGYRPLDEFWSARGYVRQPQLRVEYSWRDANESAESPKPMVFWTRRLKTTLASGRGSPAA